MNQNLADVFGADGILSKRLAGYEPRPGQLQMAEAVGRVLAAGVTDGEGASGVLAVEAGTGTGKTLAYLIPAVLSGQKIVISTGTLNLQDQILEKEIPFIIEHIDADLSALCVKGRQNYICLYRFNQLAASRQLRVFADDAEITVIREWLAETESGDRAELNWLPDDSMLWDKISSNTSKCLGMHCPEGGGCFVNQLRKKAARARIVIVNHHLFFSDLALRRFGNAEVLPRYESVIFDEAHHIENVATRYFGTSFSHYQVVDLVADIDAMAKTNLKKELQAKTVQLAAALSTQAQIFASAFPKERGRYPLAATSAAIKEWPTLLDDLFARLDAVGRHLETLLTCAESWGGLMRRCETLLTDLRFITQHHDSSYVYWVERHLKAVQLTASPVEIAPELQEYFFGKVRSAIFTSATLTTGGSFKYFFERLGLGEGAETLALDTPFDYGERTLLYVPPNDFPLPSDPGFQQGVGAQVLEIIEHAGGRSLVLFTSVNGMKNCYSYLAGKTSHPLLMQGDAPKAALLEEFKETTHSVLLAVASFWEGVDVPGESLSCVIIDKLPFEVPSDPVIMARMDKINSAGGKPFFDFQIPRAILTLRQGVGRLMRTSTDRGLLAILDVRLFKKSYGRIFLKSMPPSPVCRDMGKVADFLAR